MRYNRCCVRSKTLKATSTWYRDTAPETKTKTRRFKEVSRPDGQHLPSTATSSRVTLEHAWTSQETEVDLGRARQQDTRTPMDTAYHHLETLRKEKTWRKAGETWRDELDDYWKGTIWQRIAQDRQMWKQHAEAFAQLRDITATQWWRWPNCYLCYNVKSISCI